MIIYTNTKCKGKNSDRNRSEILVNNAVAKFVQNFSQLPYRHFENGDKDKKRRDNAGQAYGIIVLKCPLSEPYQTIVICLGRFLFQSF
jgi:hypothetical protein